MSSFKSALLACASIILLCLSNGCTSGKTASNEIRVHLPAEPVTLDPALAEDDYAVKVLCNTMEGLFVYDNAGSLNQGLAENVEVSADRKVYTFTLRPQAKWSDGRLLAPSDFVLGLKRALDPKTGSKLANMLFSIKGAKDFYKGRAQESAVGVSEKGGKLVIELERPTAYFLHALTLAQAAPSRADVLEKHKGHWPSDGPSTGPYKLVKYAHEQEIRLEPNANYWNAERLRLLPVVFKIIPDESQALQLFEAGKLDVVGRVPALDLPRLRSAGLIKEFYQIATFFLAFNTRKAPFDDREFRRAVAGAIDRVGILKALESTSKPARSWVPPELPGFIPYEDSTKVFADSMAKVKAKLEKKPNGPITAFLTTGNQNALLMEKVQQDLLTKLGMKIGLQSMEFKSYVNLLRTDTPQIYRFQRGAPFMDPIWHLMSFVGDDTNNFTGWKNAEYDHLVDEIVTTPNGPERTAKILRAQKILVDDEAVVVPVYHAWQTHVVSPRITGYRANPINEVHYNEVGLAAGAAK